MQDLFRSPLSPTLRRIFVSYHHDTDQGYYDQFTTAFAGAYEVIRDNSLDRRIDSDDPDYVMRRIRENYITGTSCTVVLCGAQTPWRKYVDWEIKATLDKGHGLVGVNLPNNPSDVQGRVQIPDRLRDNLESGYALWVSWVDLTGSPGYLRQCIELANSKAGSLRQNGRPLRRRNG